MPRQATFAPKQTDKGWVINIPSSMTPDGRRRRRFFPTRDDARVFSEKLQTQYKNEGAAALGLSAEERVLASKAFDLMQKAGLEDFLQVVREGIFAVSMRLKSKPLGEIFDAYIESRKRSAIYTNSLRRSRRRLGDLGDTLASEITPEVLQEHLLGLKPTYRNALLREIRAVFGFAVKRGWCAVNPVARMDFDPHVVGEREVFTVDESSRLLKKASTKYKDLLPYVALGLFSGIRVFELMRLDWENIDLEENTINLPSGITKRKRQRSVDIEPVLKAWLTKSMGKKAVCSGPVCPTSYNVLRKRVRNLSKASKVVWRQNALRHSYASYWLAKNHDLSRLALQLGHAGGLDVLHRFYHRAVKTKDAEAYWNLTPE